MFIHAMLDFVTTATHVDYRLVYAIMAAALRCFYADCCLRRLRGHAAADTLSPYAADGGHITSALPQLIRDIATLILLLIFSFISCAADAPLVFTAFHFSFACFRRNYSAALRHARS